MVKIKYFTEEEFSCDGVNCWEMMSAELLIKLDLARAIAETPFVITSSWRSIEANERAGGKANSAHLRGNAVDIACGGSSDRFRIVDALLTAGFRRIGISKSFVHCDTDELLPEPVIWTY